MAATVRRKRPAAEAERPPRKRSKVAKTKGGARGTEPSHESPKLRLPSRPHDAVPPSLPPHDPSPVLNHPPTQILDVLVFGNGENGELGLGSARREALVPRVNPFLFAGPLPPAQQQQVLASAAGAIPVVQLDCGGMHTVALSAANQIVTWGVNDNGALGRPTAWAGGLKDVDDAEGTGDGGSDAGSDGALNPLESTPTPIPASFFPPGTTFVQVAAGDSCSLALTDTGRVYGWGTFKTTNGDEMFCYDEAGQLVERQSTPVLLHGLTDIIQIACGANHAMALDSKGVVWTWGSAEQNQLGYRPGLRGAPSHAADDSLTPRPVGIRNVRAIATGEYHAFAIDRRGDVWGWGFNGFGETGGDPASAGKAGAPLLLPAPTKIKALHGQGVVRLDGGAHHSAAVTADGRCLVWGQLDGGQLGVDFSAEQLADPTLIRRDERGRPRICLRPTAVAAADKTAWTFVACGTDHTLFVDAGGAAYATGFNAQGQLGTGSEEDVKVAQRLGGKSIAKRRVTWAGAGGQFSIVAGPHVPADA